VFGGTFDPVHTGHIAIASAARNAFDLDQVLFVPAARPRLRATAPVAPVDHRVAMVRLAIRDVPWARVSLVDAVRPGPAYSVDTLGDLRAEFPRDDFFLIIGADSLASLPDWKDPAMLVRLATIVCVGRPGGPRPEALPPGHPGRHVRYVEGPMIGVNATEIRRRVKAGEPIAGMVDGAVEAYIREHRLYHVC
jgi:nicotinate-nucleotide adenylyltransferase